MRNAFRIFVAAITLGVVVVCLCTYSKSRAEAATRHESAGASLSVRQAGAGSGNEPSVVEPDSLYGPSFASLAWSLFLQAMTPRDGAPVFESWTEQCKLTAHMAGCPSEDPLVTAMREGRGRSRLLHASIGMRAQKVPGSDCGLMLTASLAGYPAPANLSDSPVYCEEVYVSPAEASFIKTNLLTLTAQQTYGKLRSGAINFPGTEQNESRLEIDALEIKVDWVPASTFRNPTFACPDPTHQLYTETIDGTCYALAAVHISSKVMPNWLWATFEPANAITNPNRCDPKLYGSCFDPWGTTSQKPYGKGITVRQSDELNHAMVEAKLAPALHNYYLTGVQTQFVDHGGKPVQLGNSFIEFNQGVPPGKSSCITCHQYAAFDGSQPRAGMPQNDYGRPPHGWPSIGYACNRSQSESCYSSSTNSTAQDFSWVLGLMPYNSGVAVLPPGLAATKGKQLRDDMPLH